MATDGGTAESEALARYRAASRRRRGTPGAKDRRRTAWRTLQQTPSGPGPDARDPQRLGSVWRSLADGRGWTSEMAVWSLANRWPQIVGPQVAEHVSVVAFDPRSQPAAADAAAGPSRGEQASQPSLFGEASQAVDRTAKAGGKLTLMADSNAWQQEMIWNLALLQRRLDAELGPGVVGSIVVLKPPLGRRSLGPRRVRT
jgi:predicted nucleic acid-binding Zn ribbon protein